MTTERLWAPWRAAYIKSARKESAKGCLFCQKPKRKSDSKDQILVRGRLGFSLLNRFPYNNGHLLIAPYRHIGNLQSLTQEEWLEMFTLTRDSIERIEKALSPQGFNIGLNLGRAAGAGIPGHLHLHIVPRWVGDTNFMPTVAHTKVISQSLEATHRLLLQVQSSYDKKHRC